MIINLNNKNDILFHAKEIIKILDNQKEYITLADVFLKYEGTKEYDGVVSIIQNWFYGDLIKAPWCATSICWGLAQLGLFDYTVHKRKTDNVYLLHNSLYTAFEEKKIDMVHDGEGLRRGDIIILNFSKLFATTSSKHVTVFLEDDVENIKCIGGNQNNGFFTKSYKKEFIKYVYRPHYYNETITDLEMLPNA